MVYIKVKKSEDSVIFMMDKNQLPWVLKTLLIQRTIQLTLPTDATVKLIPEVGHLKKLWLKSPVKREVLTEVKLDPCIIIDQKINSLVVTVLLDNQFQLVLVMDLL